jgi:hypothetical protein
MLGMSSDFVQFPPQKVQEELYLVGFRVDPNAEGPELFTLIASGGENDRPLVAKGRVLFFRKPKDAALALAKSDNDMKRLGQPPTELALFCDVAEVLHLVNAKQEDPDGLILECIGCFDDLVRAAKVNVPAEYMSLLSAMSERLMESNEFGSFLADKGLDREKLEDALMWCVGAVAVKATVV